MDLRLKNRTALITGSSRGIGFATALMLAREGTQIVINGRDASRLQVARDRILQQIPDAQILMAPGDITHPDIPGKIIQSISEKWGALDILISNTGGPPPGAFSELTDDAWEKATRLSFLSHVQLIKAALPELQKSDAASVLTITSISVKQPIPNMILSNSIRAATVALTKSLSLELGNQGIRFNSLLPGWTETERVSQLMNDRAARNQTSVDSETQKQALESALERMAQPDEIASAAVFLVSPAASYITGVMLNVDGGMYKGLL